jgi:hypothetical protein
MMVEVQLVIAGRLAAGVPADQSLAAAGLSWRCDP